MKLIYKLIKYLNIYIIFILYTNSNQDRFMLAKNDNASDYFIYYNEKKYLLGSKKQNIKED